MERQRSRVMGEPDGLGSGGKQAVRAVRAVRVVFIAGGRGEGMAVVRPRRERWESW